MKRRWQFLCGEVETSPDAAAQAAAETAESADPTPPSVSHADLSAATVAQLPSTTQVSGAQRWDDSGMQPSSFSVLKDSLKTHIDQIYSDVQKHLPSALDADDSDAEGASKERFEPSTFQKGESEHLTNGKGEDAESSDEASSEDSAEEDFAKMRRAVRSSSIEIAGPDRMPSSGPPAAALAAAEASAAAAKRRLAFAPPPREAPKARAAFVRLELQSSDEDEEVAPVKAEEEEPDDESDESDDSEAEEDGDLFMGVRASFESIAVIQRLLQKAPTGDCPWDTWLDSVRRLPRLQVDVGPPEFFRRDGDLRVTFDVDKLRRLLASEKQGRIEQRQKRQDLRRRFRQGPHEFVQEAERRRAMLGNRLGSGFVLAPRSSALEAMCRPRKQSESP